MSHARLVSSLLVTSLSLVGCGDDDGQAMGTDAGHRPEPSENCPAWASELTYGPSGLLAETDGEITARVMKADHVPPVKGLNQWTLRLERSSGAGGDADGGSDGDVTGYQISWLCAFMPQHSHTWGPTLDDPTDSDGDGLFEVDRLNLAMYGGWEIPLWVDPIGSDTPPYSRQVTTDWCKPVPDPSRPPDMVFRVCVPRQ